ncbi:MAG: hypothetical protein ACK559_31810, partial [bacterium]
AIDLIIPDLSIDGLLGALQVDEEVGAQHHVQQHQQGHAAQRPEQPEQPLRQRTRLLGLNSCSLRLSHGLGILLFLLFIGGHCYFILHGRIKNLLY